MAEEVAQVEVGAGTLLGGAGEAPDMVQSMVLARCGEVGGGKDTHRGMYLLSLAVHPSTVHS